VICIGAQTVAISFTPGLQPVVTPRNPNLRPRKPITERTEFLCDVDANRNVDDEEFNNE
jgi:hypothetical protein